MDPKRNQFMIASSGRFFEPFLPSISMGLGRVELPTSRVSGVRSNHLSYRPHYTACSVLLWSLEL